MKSAMLGISVVVSGVVTWVDVNLGSLFWIVVILGLVEIVEATVMDAMGKTKEVPSKFLKTFGAMGMPVLLRTFSQGISVSSLHSSFQIVFAVIIMAQLVAVVPNTLSLLKLAASKLSGGSKSETLAIEKLGQAELMKLLGDINAQIQKNAPSESQQASTVEHSAMGGGKES